MNIGSTILHLRKDRHLTQEEFGHLFHVTRQAVSNWELGRTYPDLQTLVAISNQFNLSLDAMLKTDAALVQRIDRESALGRLRRTRRLSDRLCGAGTGLIASCCLSPASALRSIVIALALGLILTGWYVQTTHDRRLLHLMTHDEHDRSA